MNASETERIAVLETKVDALDTKVDAMGVKLEAIHESIMINQGYDKAVTWLVRLLFILIPMGLWFFGGSMDLAHLITMIHH